ncbi:MAG: Gfo/Idh/MocA family oxidoreductase [Candidatus Binatota bacterium]
MAQPHDNRKLRVGVIGGGFGRNHLLAYQATDGVEVAAFCQRTRASAEKVAGEFHIPQLFTDYRELLALKGLDAVSIAAPPYLHHPIVMEAFARGLHVLCEKPLALNRREAETMVLRAEETKRVHMTAFNFRFIPAMTRMKELLEEGYVGDRIYHVDGVWFSERRADLNASLSWRYKKELAAVGALGDVGVHLIDLIRWLVGDFRKVCAHAATFTKERSLPDGSGKGSVTVEDACVFIAELAGEVQTAIQVSGVARGGVYQGIRIFGNKGALRLEIDRRDPDWLAGRLLGAQGSSALQPLPIPERLTQGLNRLTPERTTGEFIFAHLTRRFVEAIRTGRQAVPSFHDGLEAQKVIDAILKSAQEEQWVKVV